LAFEEWYVANHGRVVAGLLLVSGDVDVTREAVDEAFARAYAHWGRVGRMESPAGWTFRVALNVLRRSRRRASRERKVWTDLAPRGVVPAPAGEAWDVVKDLPVRQRTAVVLRYVADLTQVEIGEVMGITRSAVASLLTDAHDRLADLIPLELVDMEPRDE
jgi:DNA-directed RNA polymerase specialized sigma24 family protein